MSSETSTTPRRGRRPNLSLDAAVELMDESGHTALTFRALAARLGTGVGAIYHYVSGRDELLDLTTNEILGGVLDEVELPDEPFEALRALSTALYRGMQAHTWAALYLMRDTGTQPNSLRVFETFGQQFLALGLDAKTCFDATSTLVSFVTGAGAEMREIPDVVTTEHRTQAEQLRIYADEWRALDANEFPFLHRIADTFAEHDDLEQFQAGVDLFLDGVRARLGRRDAVWGLKLRHAEFQPPHNELRAETLHCRISALNSSARVPRRKGRQQRWLSALPLSSASSTLTSAGSSLRCGPTSARLIVSVLHHRG